MKRAVVFFIILTGMVWFDGVLSHQAFSWELYDDFNDNSFDQNKWIVYPEGNSTISEQNGKIILSSTGSGHAYIKVNAADLKGIQADLMLTSNTEKRVDAGVELLITGSDILGSDLYAYFELDSEKEGIAASIKKGENREIDLYQSGVRSVAYNTVYTLAMVVTDDDKMEFYLNNQLFATSGPIQDLTLNAQNFFMGIWNSSADHIEAQIDNAKILTVDDSSPVELNDGLVAHYPFEGDADADSGYGVDGTAHGDLAYVPGTKGQAANFDGVDDYISIDSTSDFTSNSFSIVARVQTLSDFSRATIWSQWSSGSVSDNLLFKITQENKLNLAVRRQGSGTPTHIYSTATVPTDEWAFVAVSYDGSTGDGCFYINDQRESFSVGFTSRTISARPIVIGKPSYNYETVYPAKFSDYKLDDLYYYNRALSASEIQSFYSDHGSSSIDNFWFKFGQNGYEWQTYIQESPHKISMHAAENVTAVPEQVNTKVGLKLSQQNGLYLSSYIGAIDIDSEWNFNKKPLSYGTYDAQITVPMDDSGIVTAFFLYNIDFDTTKLKQEIDFEFLPGGQTEDGFNYGYLQVGVYKNWNPDWEGEVGDWKDNHPDNRDYEQFYFDTNKNLILEDGKLSINFEEPQTYTIELAEDAVRFKINGKEIWFTKLVPEGPFQPIFEIWPTDQTKWDAGDLVFSNGENSSFTVSDFRYTEAGTGSLTQTQVSQLYVSIFGRASEGEGNAYWRSTQNDMTTAASTMLSSSAARSYFGETLTNNQMFIEFIYENTLGKTYAQDPEGVDFWVGQLESGKSKGQVVSTLINAAMDPVFKGLAAQDRFINKVAVCNYTADTITTCPDVNDLSPFVDLIKNVTDDPATLEAAKAAVDAF